MGGWSMKGGEVVGRWSMGREGGTGWVDTGKGGKSSERTEEQGRGNHWKGAERRRESGNVCRRVKGGDGQGSDRE